MLFWTVVACITAEVPAGPGCADCHGSGSDPTPPEALGGVTDPLSWGVGAHQTHSKGTATGPASACNECHLIPATNDSPGHLDDSPGAEVLWENGAIAKLAAEPYDAVGHTCTVYCHGDDPVGWTAFGSQGCGSCHGNPPAESHQGIAAGECSRCHSDGGTDNPANHVNGVVDGPFEEAEAESCALGCHGTEDSQAPPPDLAGNTDSSSPGVGAHVVHVNGGPGFPPAACTVCHTQPQTLSSPGHLQDVPADNVFSGIAVTGGRVATYDPSTQTCSQTYCHASPGGAGTPTGITPTWTAGPQGCGDCHGNPPHRDYEDYGYGCAFCHLHSGDDPTLHLDGVQQVYGTGGSGAG